MAAVQGPAGARLGLSRAALWALGPALFALGLCLSPARDDLLPRPLLQTLGLLLAPLLAAWLAAAWLRRPLAPLLALAWLLLLAGFAGPLPLLATALVALAALALGGRVAPAQDPAVQLALGLVLIAGLLGWLLPLPLHQPWTYAPPLLALVAWRRQALLALLRRLHHGGRAAVAAAPRSAAWAVATLGLLSTAAWLPTLQNDDIAYHLGLPSQLHQLGVYRLDARSQVWALAPWAGDVLHALVQVLADREARGALNALWLLLLAALGWRLTRRLGEDAAGGFAAVALMASLPSLVWLLGGMQVELPAAVFALAIATVLAAGAHADDARARTWTLAILAAGLLALKVSHVLLLLPLVLWWLLQTRARLPWRSVLAASVVAALLAGSSYAYAWLVSGNPLLPLGNDWFPNAYAQGRGLDSRWLAGLRWDLPWRMAFHTGDYVEAYAGGIGFLLVLPLGGLLCALARGPARALAWAGVAAWLLPLLLLQYARYTVPALLLLVPALVVGARALGGARAGLALLALTWAANILFFANGSWIWRAGAVKRLLDPDAGIAVVWQDFGPERALSAQLRDRAGLRVLVLGPDPAYADYGGRGFSASPYDPELHQAVAAARAAGDAAAWRTLLRQYGFSHLSLRPGHDPAFDALLPALGAVREQAVGRVELWRLPAPAAGRDLMRERDASAALRAGRRPD